MSSKPFTINQALKDALRPHFPEVDQASWDGMWLKSYRPGRDQQSTGAWSWGMEGHGWGYQGSHETMTTMLRYLTKGGQPEFYQHPHTLDITIGMKEDQKHLCQPKPRKPKTPPVLHTFSRKCLKR